MLENIQQVIKLFYIFYNFIFMCDDCKCIIKMLNYRVLSFKPKIKVIIYYFSTNQADLFNIYWAAFKDLFQFYLYFPSISSFVFIALPTNLPVINCSNKFCPICLHLFSIFALPSARLLIYTRFYPTQHSFCTPVCRPRLATSSVTRLGAKK